MCMEGSDRGGGDPGLYDGWKGPAPRAQRKRSSRGDAALTDFHWSGGPALQAGAGVTRLLHLVPLVPLQKPQGGRASEGSPVWGRPRDCGAALM